MHAGRARSLQLQLLIWVLMCEVQLSWDVPPGLKWCPWPRSDGPELRGGLKRGPSPVWPLVARSRRPCGPPRSVVAQLHLPEEVPGDGGKLSLCRDTAPGIR